MTVRGLLISCPAPAANSARAASFSCSRVSRKRSSRSRQPRQPGGQPRQPVGRPASGAAQRWPASAPRRRRRPPSRRSTSRASPAMTAGQNDRGQRRPRPGSPVRQASGRSLGEVSRHWLRASHSAAHVEQSAEDRRVAVRRLPPASRAASIGKVTAAATRWRPNVRPGGLLARRRLAPAGHCKARQGMFGQPAGHVGDAAAGQSAWPARQTTQSRQRRIAGKQLGQPAGRPAAVVGQSSHSASAAAERSAMGRTQRCEPATRGGRLRMGRHRLSGTAVTRRERPRCPGDGTSAPRASRPRTACA